MKNFTTENIQELDCNGVKIPDVIFLQEQQDRDERNQLKETLVALGIRLRDAATNSVSDAKARLRTEFEPLAEKLAKLSETVEKLPRECPAGLSESDVAKLIDNHLNIEAGQISELKSALEALKQSSGSDTLSIFAGLQKQLTELQARLVEFEATVLTRQELYCVVVKLELERVKARKSVWARNAEGGSRLADEVLAAVFGSDEPAPLPPITPLRGARRVDPEVTQEAQIEPQYFTPRPTDGMAQVDVAPVDVQENVDAVKVGVANELEKSDEPVAATSDAGSDVTEKQADEPPAEVSATDQPAEFNSEATIEVNEPAAEAAPEGDAPQA